MRRVFVLWERPSEASREAVLGRVEGTLWTLRQAEVVEGAALVRLASAGRSHPVWYEWLLELHVDDEAAAALAEEEPALRDVIAELGSLGLKPIVLREAGQGVSGWP
jgi:hypothetical protein